MRKMVCRWNSEFSRGINDDWIVTRRSNHLFFLLFITVFVFPHGEKKEN